MTVRGHMSGGSRARVAVVGAGPAGLAVAATLARRGVSAAVLERGASVATSWRGHYDRLHLHTVRWLSHLPGYRIPRTAGRWVSRDEVIAYLERYAVHHDLEIRTGVTVRRVERSGDGWSLRCDDGGRHDLRARAVVVATGYNHSPLLPEWPGRRTYRGTLCHAADYRNGTPFRGQDVLVVGAGNTGAEIAVDLVEHGAARVRLAFRTPPHILRRSQFGIPTQLVAVLLRHAPVALADRLAEPVRKRSVPRLDHKGLPDPGPGVYRGSARGEIPILDTGVVDAVLDGRVEPVPAVTGFDGDRVRLADGTAIRPDAVIAATGYRRGLEPLVGHLGVLGPTGLPLVHGPRTHRTAPGLHFIGYTNPPSGMFREITLDARQIAAALSRTDS
ncbi:NAD(P)/FAD-dependent oxidoreductase [Amycolatopsis sp. K13G38]|uniref:NAD(P)/FAD-dependent oxidoreductase n=2 Tax=Amycolatopsis acididurans TaxID=2724524 RepID=A0ABX1JEW7_9PSEU|nr:NAD(P)/FAD-dependent oxidoreductase [Amycolatopsis acididurans]